MSNLAHIVVGTLLGAVSVLAALEFFSVVSGGWRYLWHGLLFVVSLFVPLFILWAAREHKVAVARVLSNPQQKQHFTLSGLLFAGGLAEMAVMRMRRPGP